MALAFETMAAEQRETARLATTRRRDAWKKDTELERHLHSTAEVTAVTRTELEDAVVAAGLLPEEDITKVAKLRAGRRAWTRMDNMYKRLEVATKFGLTAAERLFGAQEEVEGITQEEEKRLVKVLKQLQDETKEKTGRKRKDREETDEAKFRQQENYMTYGGGGGFRQMGGGMPTQAPWFDHVSYNPVCPNFIIHMQQLAAKAATIQRSAASQGQVSADRTVALRDGKGN